MRLKAIFTGFSVRTRWRAAYLLAAGLCFGPTAMRAGSINTTALCGNPQYCVYTDESAFVSAVGTNPLGQDNFGGYAPGDYSQVGPVTTTGSLFVCPSGGHAGVLTCDSNSVPNGYGNYLVGTSLVSSANSFAYLGFDYTQKDPFTTSATFSTSVGSFIEPLSGFFGLISSGSSVGASCTATTGTSDCPIDNVLWANGPGISATNPLYPDTGGGGCGTGKICWFWPVVIGTNLFFDPAVYNAYTYQTLDGSLFTSVSGFPSGFASGFDVSSGGVDYGLFVPGQTLTFPGGGVSQFTISGITPNVDGSSPTAFPIQLGLNQLNASVEAIAIDQAATTPEPGSFGLVVGCLFFVTLYGVRRRRSKNDAQSR